MEYYFKSLYYAFPSYKYLLPYTPRDIKHSKLPNLQILFSHFPFLSKGWWRRRVNRELCCWQKIESTDDDMHLYRTCWLHQWTVHLTPLCSLCFCHHLLPPISINFPLLPIFFFMLQMLRHVSCVICVSIQVSVNIIVLSFWKIHLRQNSYRPYLVRV